MMRARIAAARPQKYAAWCGRPGCVGAAAHAFGRIVNYPWDGGWMIELTRDWHLEDSVWRRGRLRSNHARRSDLPDGVDTVVVYRDPQGMHQEVVWRASLPMTLACPRCQSVQVVDIRDADGPRGL